MQSDQDKLHPESDSNQAIQKVIHEIFGELLPESIGKEEVELIQQRLYRAFRTDRSPAAIARVLADQGSACRHPEILECDAQWRAKKFLYVKEFEALVRGPLQEAANAFVVLEQARKGLCSKPNELRQFLQAAQDARQERLLMSKNKLQDDRAREEAAEVAEWLRVWLGSPGLISDWLDLRLGASDFVERFGVLDVQGSKRDTLS